MKCYDARILLSNGRAMRNGDVGEKEGKNRGGEAEERRGEKERERERERENKQCSQVLTKIKTKK